MPVRFALATFATLLPVAYGMALATPEAAKLYGRVAEKQLYLDKRVGACCHSALRLRVARAGRRLSI